MTEQDAMEWIKSENHPPDCRGYANRSRYIICNDGFVTVGYWYPFSSSWVDVNAVDITSQVTHWMRFPDAP